MTWESQGNIWENYLKWKMGNNLWKSQTKFGIKVGNPEMTKKLVKRKQPTGN